jgi:DNA-binding NarL/FixJ family response regulator
MPLRCLIVDDNTGFLKAARVLLDRHGLDVVGLASTGAEALRLAHELRPDVALVDINLGEESGFDLARLLFEEEELSPLSLVLISHRPEPGRGIPLQIRAVRSRPRGRRAGAGRGLRSLRSQ